MDVNEFIRNISAHTLEQLDPYVGQHVAWSEDGKQILAHAPELGDLYRILDQRGITRYVTDFIAPPDEVFLGGAGL